MRHRLQKSPAPPWNRHFSRKWVKSVAVVLGFLKKVRRHGELFSEIEKWAAFLKSTLIPRAPTEMAVPEFALSAVSFQRAEKNVK